MSVDFLGTGTEQEKIFKAMGGMQKRPIIFLGLGGVGSASVSKIKDLIGRNFSKYRKEGKQSPIPDGVSRQNH